MKDHALKQLRKFTLFFLSFCLLLTLIPLEADAFSSQVIQIGATGDDVIELQARLQYIGYYKGKIDGVFGWGTYWSVRNFQNDFGLDIDGLVGGKMKNKLQQVTYFDKNYVHGQLDQGKEPKTYGKSGQTKSQGPPPGQRNPGNNNQRKAVPHEGAKGGQPAQPPQQGQAGQQPAPQQPTPQQQAQPPKIGRVEKALNLPEGFSANDLKLMANAVYGEARGEPYEGQVAVAAIILNRVKDPRFPNTVSGVIFEPLAFTAVADGQIWLEPNETAKRAVQDAISGWDPTGGLVYYFNPNTATSAWMHSRERVKQIGKHVFLR